MAALVYARGAPRQLALRRRGTCALLRSQGDMADLEDHAIQRDKRFVFRLVVSLILAAIAGLWIASHLTSSSTAGCAASLFGEAAPPTSTSAPP
jgi:hypothetical protein